MALPISVDREVASVNRDRPAHFRPGVPRRGDHRVNARGQQLVELAQLGGNR